MRRAGRHREWNFLFAMPATLVQRLVGSQDHLPKAGRHEPTEVPTTNRHLFGSGASPFRSTPSIVPPFAIHFLKNSR
jgi:hypothetical protein